VEGDPESAARSHRLAVALRLLEAEAARLRSEVSKRDGLLLSLTGEIFSVRKGLGEARNAMFRRTAQPCGMLRTVPLS